MRAPGVLGRLGMVVTWGTLLAGSLAGAYALARALHHLVYVGFSGEKDAVKHLVLYPLGIVVAGSLVALLGLVLMFLADSTLGPGRPKPSNGRPDGRWLP